MKKLLLSAAITAALFGGQAQATVLTLTAGAPNLTAALAGTVKEVWISGSSAATPFVEKSIAANCAGTVYKYSNSTNDFTWVCNSSIAAGTINIVHKRDAGGSVTGVQSALGIYPTYWVTASLNAASCAAATNSNGVTVTPCTPSAPSAATHAGDIDLSDVDGAQFGSVANGGVAGTNRLTASALATQIFGVVVNTRLYAAMQVAEVATGRLPASCISTSIVGGVNNASFTMPIDNSDACMPSLTTAQISAVFGAGRATDWYNLYFGNSDNTLQSLVGVQFANDQPANTDVHYCSRTAGSGTLASFNIKFENACSTKTTEAIVTASAQTLGTESSAFGIGGQKVVHSMNGSGDLENCLEGLNAGAAKGTFSPLPAQLAGTAGFRWAIGIMGLDRNATVAKNYRFIKIDNVAPTAVNVVNGKYKYWAELANMTTTTNPLALDIIANLGSANQITALNVTHPFGLSGFLGTATNPNFLPTYDLPIAPGTLINAAFDVNRPVNPWTHTTAAGVDLNHCRTPSIPAGTRAIPSFN